MEPIVNLQENIGKTVGRRKAPRNAFAYAMGLQSTVATFQRTLKRGLCPRGVYRFHSHEEADAWMMKMISRSRPTTS